MSILDVPDVLFQRERPFRRARLLRLDQAIAKAEEHLAALVAKREVWAHVASGKPIRLETDAEAAVNRLTEQVDALPEGDPRREDLEKQLSAAWAALYEEDDARKKWA